MKTSAAFASKWKYYIITISIIIIMILTTKYFNKKKETFFPITEFPSNEFLIIKSMDFKFNENVGKLIES